MFRVKIYSKKILIQTHALKTKFNNNKKHLHVHCDPLCLYINCTSGKMYHHHHRWTKKNMLIFFGGRILQNKDFLTCDLLLVRSWRKVTWNHEHGPLLKRIFRTWKKTSSSAFHSLFFEDAKCKGTSKICF